jgi:acyl carrier protein
VFEQLRRLMAGKYQLEAVRITPDSTLRELGLDSLDLVELAMAIESEWGPRVSDDELNEAQQLAAIVELVESRMARI